MATKLQQDEIVHVSCRKVSQLTNRPAALYRSKIVEVENRSAKIQLKLGPKE